MMELNQQQILETERLLLVPMTFEFVSKILENDISAYEDIDIEPTPEWPNMDTREILPIIKEKLSSQPIPDGFGPWLFIDKRDKCIIGDGGFKGSPNSKGEIDLGYGIIESKRRQGYTFEAVTSLIKWGISQENVKVITADCLKDNTASRNLLRKLGMAEIKQDDRLIYFALNSYGKVKLTNLCPVFISENVKKTVDFYVEKLGFIFAAHYDIIDNFATIYRDDIEFIIVQAKFGKIESNTKRYGAGYDAYINTDTVQGVDVVYEEFKTKDVKIVSEPKKTDYGSYEFVIEDIDGRLVGIGLIFSNEIYFENSNYLESKI